MKLPRPLAGVLATASTVVAGVYLDVTLRTVRWQVVTHPSAQAVVSGRQQAIALIWHEFLPYAPALWREAIRSGNRRRLHVMVSRHRDGQALTRLFARWGLEITAGSSDSRKEGGPRRRKGGAQALRKLLALHDAGDMVGLTPDGPRGPRRVSAPGATLLAAHTGLAVLPMAGATRPGWPLPTWDHMRIPLPFARGVLVYGAVVEPSRVRQRSEADTTISDALNAAAREAERWLAGGSSKAPAATQTGRSRAALLAWRGLASLAPPILRLLLRYRVAKGKEDAARLDERRGLGMPPSDAWKAASRRVWLHAASVGETVSILPVIARLLAEPDVALLVTTSTLTGAEILAQHGPPQTLHRFMPLDVPRWVDRMLDRWRPQVAGFVDSEIWPNTLAALHRRAIPTVMINARLSSRSHRRWQTAQRLLGATPFGLVSTVVARSGADADRIAQLRGPRATVIGDLKQSAPPLPVDPVALAALQTGLEGRPVWLAACTHDGEEALIADVHARLVREFPKLVTIIAPRHPPRAAAIVEALGPLLQRSAGAPLPESAGLYLWDTLGELGLLYHAVGVVFVGNSLGGRASGGHNPYEPARCGAAVATGLHTSNFTEAVTLLAADGGLAVIDDLGALERWVAAMLRDPEVRARQAQIARDRASAASDLPQHVAALLLDAVDQS